MPWIKVDDRFDEHPKHAAVGPVGWGVWLAGLAYCNRNLTDGFIPYSVAERLGGSWRIWEPIEDAEELDNEERATNGRERVWTIDIGSGYHGETISTEWVIGHLIRVGLWEEAPGGYRVHDYLDYNPDKAAVLKERQRWAEKKARSRVSRQESPRDSKGDSRRSPNGPVPVPVPEGSKEPSPLPPEEDEGGVFDAYYQLTARPPSKAVISWLTRLVADFGVTLVIGALGTEWKASADPATLLGRVQTRLADEALRAGKAAEERRKRAAIEEVEALKDAMPEEARKANLVRLGDMMREKGLI